MNVHYLQQVADFFHLNKTIALPIFISTCIIVFLTGIQKSQVQEGLLHINSTYDYAQVARSET